MRSYKEAKLNSSSIQESVISIAIISIAIVMAMRIFFNVTQGSFNQVSYQLLLNKLEEIKFETLEKNKTDNNFIVFEGYGITKKIEKNKNDFFLKLVVTRDDKVILKKKYYLRSNEL